MQMAEVAGGGGERDAEKEDDEVVMEAFHDMDPEERASLINKMKRKRELKLAKIDGAGMTLGAFMLAPGVSAGARPAFLLAPGARRFC